MKRMLADVRPELINEWSQRNLPLTPDSVTHGSNKIVWWNGKCGHEWRASIKNRVKGINKTQPPTNISALPAVSVAIISYSW